MDIKIKTTERGFDLIEFVDCYGEKCNIQKSSLAEVDAIWYVGVDWICQYCQGEFVILKECHGIKI